jgi:hypothetical protein
MKELISILVLSAATFSTSLAQDNATPTYKNDRPHKHNVYSNSISPIYITVSTGINNNTGVVGVGLEVPVTKQLSVEGGVGASTWGTKVYGGGKYYLRPGHRGWAFGAGITYNSGIATFNETLATINDDNEPVTLDLKPQVNLFLAAYQYFRLGRGNNRFYLEYGFSVPMSGGDKFDQTGGTEITSSSASAVRFLSPGGIIVAAGFSFGPRPKQRLPHRS